MELEIQWKEFDLNDIIRYYAKGLKPKKRKEKIKNYHYYIDTHLRKVVFSVVIEKE